MIRVLAGRLTGRRSAVPPLLRAPAKQGKAGLAARERVIIWALVVYGAVQVWLAAAAFPLFSNVDEQFHFDRVVAAARGRRAVAGMQVSEESARVIAACQTWEYLNVPPVGPLPETMIIPWKLPTVRRDVVLAREAGIWRTTMNREATEPPAYYLAAGWWYLLGEALGVAGVAGAFWIRFFNAVLAAGTVLAAAALGVRLAPDRPLVRWGLPLFAATVHPGNWFAINNDALPEVLCASGFWLMSGRAESRPGASSSPGRTLAGGVCLGAAISAKLTAVPVAGALALLPALAWVRGKGRGGALAAGAALAGLATPPACVALLNRWHGMSATAVDEKFTGLHPTLRPLAAVAAHPLWTWGGMWSFLSGLGADICPGRLFWHRAEISAGTLGLVAFLLALLGATGSIAGLMRRAGRRDPNPSRTDAELVALMAASGSVAMLAALSVLVDFGRNFYSSDVYPIFTNGRYLNGALVPIGFAILCGLDRISRKALAPGWQVGVALVFAAWLGVHEAGLLGMVIGSEYNWLHLP